MGKNKDHSPEKIFELLEILSKKWMLLLLHEFITSNRLRFNELKERLSGITSRMLSQRLTELEELEFIKREIVLHKPVQIAYNATKKTQDLLPLFQALVDWSEEWT